MLKQQSSFPIELTRSSRWLHRRGKIPCDATRSFDVSSREPKNWRSFEEVDGDKSYHLDAPFIGVDFDWKNSDGSENREKKVRALDLIAKRLRATWGETSLSGHGVHLIYSCDEHAKLPDCATGEFEVYARKRQFALTGNVFDGALPTVTRLTLAEALELFHLAQPVASTTNTQIKSLDSEGRWDDDALLALLNAWKAHVPNFYFYRKRVGYAVPCPGEVGWLDGARHSTPRLSQDALVFIRDGWPCFECLHQHCRAPEKKTWKSLSDYYDPLRLAFDFEEWEEGEMQRLGLTAAPSGGLL